MFIQIAITISLFLLGYALGRIKKIEQGLLGGIKPNKNKQRGFFGTKSKQEDISIDESKFVVEMSNTFEKDFQELGEKSKSKDDLSTSVSKLSKLKKKK